MSKGDAEMLGKSVIGYWGPLQTPSFGVVVNVDNGFVCIRWEEDNVPFRLYPARDIGPNWLTGECNEPGIYIYDEGDE